jgi:hypothetical protein
VQLLLIDLLNEANIFVKKIHDFQRNQLLLEEKNILRLLELEKLEKLEKLESKLITNLIIEFYLNRSIRKRKSSQKLNDEIHINKKMKKNFEDANKNERKNETKNVDDNEKDFDHDEKDFDHDEKNFDHDEKNFDVENVENDEKSEKEKKYENFEEKKDEKNEKYVENDDDINSIFQNKLKDELLLKIVITKRLRVEYVKLTMTEQKQYNQKKLNLRYLLSFFLIKMYTVQNLKNEHILNRFLRLLFHKRYEQNRQFMKISSHIIYNKFFFDIASIIATKLKMKEQKLKQCYALLKSIVNIESKAIAETTSN